VKYFRVPFQTEHITFNGLCHSALTFSVVNLTTHVRMTVKYYLVRISYDEEYNYFQLLNFRELLVEHSFRRRRNFKDEATKILLRVFKILGCFINRVIIPMFLLISRHRTLCVKTERMFEINFE
jgi:hypothetical protein